MKSRTINCGESCNKAELINENQQSQIDYERETNLSDNDSDEALDTVDVGYMLPQIRIQDNIDSSLSDENEASNSNNGPEDQVQSELRAEARIVPDSSDTRAQPQILVEHMDIIDGVIVTPPTKSRRRYILLISISALLIVAIALTASLVNRRPQVMNDASMSPSFSPSSFYEDYLKQLLVPLIGEEPFEDPLSAQYAVWKHIAVKMPLLLENNILSMNNTKGTIQRYVTTLVHISSIKDFTSILFQAEESLLPNLCKLFLCTDEGKMQAVDRRNKWSSGLGEGTIATEIGLLPSLTHIIMKGNKLYGTIPTEIATLKNLQYLDLSDNLLTGEIPTELGQMENLKTINLGSNLLKSNVPSEIGNITTLTFIDFSSNSLTGSIPNELKKLDNLEALLLYNNSLNGNFEFMCGRNFSNGLYNEETDLGQGGPFFISGEMGISIDCDGKNFCSCCRCV